MKDHIFTHEKISTDIYGLDKLFFGGIQLQNMGKSKPLTIGIYGPQGTSKALLAMQLLHGLTKNMRIIEKGIKFDAPVFLTQRNTVENLNDLLLDMLISKQTNQIIKDTITGECEWNVNDFCSWMFKLEEGNNICFPNNSSLDSFLSEEALYYNNRTNCLHIRKPGDVEGMDNMIAPRRCNSMSEYVDYSLTKKIPRKIETEFFDIMIVSSNTELEELESERKKKEDDKRKIEKKKGIEYIENKKSGHIPCVVLDGCGMMDKHVSPLLTFPEGKQLYVLILLSEKEEEVNSWKPDICIELRTHLEPEVDYLYHQLLIKKSALQTSALGWHQYKIRDYGIEVYPSSHVILQKRRHMPRALLHTHSSILSETFQQYISSDKFDQNEFYNYDPKLYGEYLDTREKRGMERLNSLYISFQPKDSCYSILERIILKGSGGEFPESTVTAFIGCSNTYKRYFTSGGTFSSCCRKEHTLNILLDKEDYIMLRQITCPVLAFNRQKNHTTSTCEKYIGEHKLENCLKCYQYIHFMDIRMGCISSDEFFYYLIQQLKVPIKIKGDDKPQHITRVVIDDLQKVDFSFPLLKKDPLFLTTLMAICKNNGVDLFILCDKEAMFAQELRTQADNVICTKRNKDDTLSVYIERYAGYNNPSHIFACHIKEVKGLFQCAWRNNKGEFSLDEQKIDDIKTPSMNDFWANIDTDKIVNALSNGKYE